MTNALSKKAKERARLLGMSVADRHSAVGFTSRSGVHFVMDASGMSARTIAERFASRLIEASAAAGRNDAADALRRLLDVPSTSDLRDAVDAAEDRGGER